MSEAHTPAGMTLAEMLLLAPVVPYLLIQDADHAVPLARALVAGGLRVLEISWRSPVAAACIARIAGEVEGAVAGAGDIRTARELKRAARAGARFAASPGFSTRLSDETTIPWLPGIATASEIMKAVDREHCYLRLFPAELAAVRAFGAVFPELRFCPFGGMTAETAKAFLAEPNVTCVGGDFMAPAWCIAEANWDHIALLAHEAAGLRGTLRSSHCLK